MSVHTVTWTIEPDLVRGSFACTAGPGSWCRSECAAGCDECHGYAGGDPHPQRDAGRCFVAEWLTGGDFAQESYDGPPAPLRSGPIVPEWDGDTWTWRYADEAPT